MTPALLWHLNYPTPHHLRAAHALINEPDGNGVRCKCDRLAISERALNEDPSIVKFRLDEHWSIEMEERG